MRVRVNVLEVGYRRVARPVLFRLGRGDPETVHHLTLRGLRQAGRWRPVRAGLTRLLSAAATPRTVFGVDFPGVVGVAAGLDKDGVAAKAWGAMGFGFAELGTVTAQAQPGNDRPRLFRLRDSEAIINRMGFNNAGAAQLAATLAAAGSVPIPLGISIGKSKSTSVSQAVGDYLSSLRLLHRYADYLAVNVSSPNTPGLRSLQDREPLDELLGALTEQAALLAEPGHRHGRPVPVLVKIAPDLTDQAIGELLQVCADRGIAGIIATNTTLGRDGLAAADRAASAEAGGLSGRPLRDRAVEVVRFVAGHSELPVIGVGGITTPNDGAAMLDAGASLLQVYTGLIYHGPGLVTGLNRAIARHHAPVNQPDPARKLS